MLESNRERNAFFEPVEERIEFDDRRIYREELPGYRIRGGIKAINEGEIKGADARRLVLGRREGACSARKQESPFGMHK